MSIAAHINTLFATEKKLGEIVEISTKGMILNVRTDGDIGRDDIQVGAYVMIGDGETTCFAKIDRVRSINKEKILIKSDFQFSYNSAENIVLEGVGTIPGLTRAAILAPDELINAIILNALDLINQDTGSESLFLDIGKLRRSHKKDVVLSAECLFEKHLAVIGTTGSGKSWTLGRIVQELARTGKKAILLDATGEFENLTENATCLYMGENPKPGKHQTKVGLPYTQLFDSDLYAIFNPSGQSQAVKLRAAMQTLKLIHLAPDLTHDGTFSKASKSKEYFDRAMQKHERAISKRGADYDIRNLVLQIENECVKPNRSAVEVETWGDRQPSEISDCLPLMNRIDEALSSDVLTPFFKDKDCLPVTKAIEDFIADPSKSLLNISLKYLSHEYKCREIIANSIGKKLMHMARDQKFYENPLITLIDEAHQFLDDMIDLDGNYTQANSFASIAKEGRKYGLHLGLATQRPNDIPEDVLSQIGSFFIHRLINESDRSVIERASSHADRNIIDSTPNLATGQAIILGIAFPIPFKVMVAPPEVKPESNRSKF